MDLERDRLKHLIIILLEALSASPGTAALDSARLQDKVLAAGLDESDVNGLLDWIEGHWQNLDSRDWPREFQPDTPSGHSFRLITEGDADCLTPDALGYLYELHRGGQIDGGQLEALLQYSSFIAVNPLQREDLPAVIEQVLFRPWRPGLVGGASEGSTTAH